jgi:hypothetical protein
MTRGLHVDQGFQEPAFEKWAVKVVLTNIEAARPDGLHVGVSLIVNLRGLTERVECGDSSIVTAPKFPRSRNIDVSRCHSFVASRWWSGSAWPLRLDCRPLQ